MKPVALIILDGWGHRDAHDANAVALARTSHFDRLWASCPHTFLTTSGLAVGLPEAVMGNSEVGHLNIGAGRIVYQALTRINEAIRRGEFAMNAVLRATCAQAIRGRGVLHLMGLVSDGGVHSHIDHLCALLDVAAVAGVPQVYVHVFADGRDTAPTSGTAFVRRVQQHCAGVRNATIASVCGRYYAMDRDRRWERTQRAYDAMVWGAGARARDPVAAMRASYDRGVTDEFIEPCVMVRDDGAPVGTMRAGDAVLFFNFRGDRARQIVRAVGDRECTDCVRRGGAPTFPALTCMTQYHQDFRYPLLFPPHALAHVLGEVVSAAGRRQLRIAETEKYAHVTFFFNGGREDPFPGEERCLIQSPTAVPTYDHQPEMRALEVTDEVVRRIDSGMYDLIVLNYANADMVGHTGVLEAAVKAVEAVDAGLGRVVDTVARRGGAALITADHGNAEAMRTHDGTPHTAHTTNPVPCLLVGGAHGTRLRDGGILADLAPTLLALLGLSQPAEMTGRSLLI